MAEKNGTVHFPTITDYEYFADNPDNKTAITSFTASRGIVTLKSRVDAADPSFLAAEPLIAEEMPEFLQEILNADKIVTIGSFYVKIDLQNQRVLAIQSNKLDSYNDLVNDNLRATGLLQFTMDDGNALEIMEGIEAGTGSINNYKDRIVKISNNEVAELTMASGPSENIITDELFSCANPGGQERKENQAWGLEFAESSCPSPGNNMARNMGDLKLVYQKVVVYFSLIAKEKCRRVCVFGGSVNTSPTISVDMFLSGTVTYKRCGWNDKSANYTSNFTNSNEKSWRPFESSRRLANYNFTVQFNQRDTRSGTANFAAMNIRSN